MTFLIVMGVIILSGGYTLYRYYIQPFPPEDEPVTPNPTPMLPQNPPVSPQTPLAAPEPSKPDLITEWALAIQDFEEYVAPGGKGRDGVTYPTGTKAWRCKNPGNIMTSGGSEITFATYEAGFTYLKNYLIRACSGNHPAYKPTMTLMEAMHVYDGDPEPAPTNYANFCAERMGVLASTQIKGFV